MLERADHRYTLGSIDREEITRIWDGDEYVQFRARVQQFDFSPCADCGGCQLAESNEEDCFGNQFPVCGDCLWARGIILCPCVTIVRSSRYCRISLGQRKGA